VLIIHKLLHVPQPDENRELWKASEHFGAIGMLRVEKWWRLALPQVNINTKEAP